MEIWFFQERWFFLCWYLEQDLYISDISNVTVHPRRLPSIVWDCCVNDNPWLVFVYEWKKNMSGMEASFAWWEVHAYKPPTTVLTPPKTRSPDTIYPKWIYFLWIQGLLPYFSPFFWRLWDIGPTDLKNQSVFFLILQCPKGSQKPLLAKG